MNTPYSQRQLMLLAILFRQKDPNAFLDKLNEVMNCIELAEAEEQAKAREARRMQITAIVLEHAKSRRFNIYKDIPNLKSKNLEDLCKYAIHEFPELSECIHKLSSNI
ncbi:hypothetical protein [Scytonema sp. NUACC26]|uniref:hypothetical protein n=1 Tax=Scytonema sp. NUACC26 TaxID=3140176 RepID=UPI0034DC4B8A